MGEVLVHPFHELSEAAESQSLCTGKTESQRSVARAPPHPHPRVTMPATPGQQHPSPLHAHAEPGVHGRDWPWKHPKAPPLWAWDPADPPRALPLQHRRAGQSHPLTIVQDDQERGQQVTHPLHVANLNVLPDVAVKEGRKAVSPLPVPRAKPLPHFPAPRPAGTCPAFTPVMLACPTSRPQRTAGAIRAHQTRSSHYARAPLLRSWPVND